MSDLKEMLATIEEHEVDDHIGRHGWGVVAKKLLKWLRYFMVCSCAWKQKAKEKQGLLILATLALCQLRTEIKDADTLASDYHGWYREEKEKAEKCKELLELLVEVRKLLDTIYAEDIISSGVLGKVYEKIEREIAE